MQARDKTSENYWLLCAFYTSICGSNTKVTLMLFFPYPPNVWHDYGVVTVNVVAPENAFFFQSNLRMYIW